MTLHDLRRRLSDSPPPEMPVPDVTCERLADRARRVAAVAARHAEDVDRQGRFPTEAIAAAREERLLGAMAAVALGGEGAGVGDLVEVCYTLGRACASSAMIFAMHQVKAACVVRHGMDGDWTQAFIRQMARDQMLLASSTTEGRNGGDVRSSEAAIVYDGSRIGLTRDASVISYGEQADAVVTTARRADDAAPTDQVLVVFRREDYTLDRTQSWDTLGMRGTCSTGFALRAGGQIDQILPEPYAVIHTQTMTPFAHLLWAGVWAGVAAGAVERARRAMRKAMRAADGAPPLSIGHFAEATASLRALRALIATNVDRYEASAADPAALSALEFQTAISLLKVDASELAVATVMAALRACGLAGYRNDSDVSIGRALRDVLSSPLMISNDRIRANVAQATLLGEVATSIRD